MAENITLAPVTSFTNDSSAVATVNANNVLIENALVNVLDRFGSSPNSMQAVLDMNSFNIVNLPAPATVNSPVRLVDVINPSIALTVPPVGTSGSTVPLLNGINTWSGVQSFGPTDINQSGDYIGLGTSLYPVYQNRVFTTATTTMGLNTITVASVIGIAVNQMINGNFAVNFLVTHISGNTITMNNPATVTNVSPTSAIFGLDRWSTTSSFLANTIGAQNIQVGGAALGNDTWLNQFPAGIPGVAEYPFLNPLVVMSSAQSAGAAVFAARMSDNSTLYPQVPTLQIYSIVDTNPVPAIGSWCVYQQSNLTNTSSPQGHIQMEMSIFSLWPTVNTDPYTLNPTGAARNLRLDNGVYAGSQPISNALDICLSIAPYTYGIGFYNGTLVSSTGDMIRAPNGYHITWYAAAATPACSIYGLQGGVATASGIVAQLNTVGGIGFGNVFSWTNGAASGTLGIDASNNIQVGSTGNFPVNLYTNGIVALTINTSQIIKFSSANSFSANASVATALSSIGPVGSHTTVQTWLTVVDNTGTTRYIPCF